MEPTTLRTTMSLWGMFTHADFFMKLLMCGLLLASVWSWAIIFNKVKTFKLTRLKIKAFEKQFWSSDSLEDIYMSQEKKPKNPLAAIFVAAMKELKREPQTPKARGINLAERIEKMMRITIDKEVERLETHMIFLASTGSVAPLLGLFGTVWGIMDSFNSIALVQNTNITAVAPGVAEALLTTAVGLITAIPALIAYNKFANDINRFTNQMETFSEELSTIISRQLDNNEEA